MLALSPSLIPCAHTPHPPTHPDPPTRNRPRQVGRYPRDYDDAEHGDSEGQPCKHHIDASAHAACETAGVDDSSLGLLHALPSLTSVSHRCVSSPLACVVCVCLDSTVVVVSFHVCRPDGDLLIECHDADQKRTTHHITTENITHVHKDNNNNNNANTSSSSNNNSNNLSLTRFHRSTECSFTHPAASSQQPRRVDPQQTHCCLTRSPALYNSIDHSCDTLPYMWQFLSLTAITSTIRASAIASKTAGSRQRVRIGIRS